MSQKNDSNDWIFPFAMIGAALYLVFVAIFAIGVFLSLVLTVVAAIAWNEPLKIGTLTIYPEGARAFVFHGLIGAALVPAFVFFCVILFDLTVIEKIWLYLVLGGYALGSLGAEILFLHYGETQSSHEQQVILPPVAETPAPTSPKPTRKKEFAFADWDDEEEF